ncbi:GGDEF domain-containing protein [Pseudoalteromonas xiamenensis]
MSKSINRFYSTLQTDLIHHQLSQRINELEFERHTLKKIQKLANVGVWKLNHLSYDVELSDELIELLALGIKSNTLTWEQFVNLLDPTGSNNMHTILMEQIILAGKKRAFEHCFFKANGQCSYLKYVCETFNNTIGQPLVTVGLIQDITEERHKSLQLQQRSVTDELTGLYNRRKLNESLYELIATPVEFSIILMDMDWFKNINDQYGHLAGDEVLMKTAKTLMQTCKSSDIIGRWGGEEFLIICPKKSLEEASKIAEQIRASVSRMLFTFSSNVTASFGIAEFSESDTVDSLIIRADKGLYEAKHSGRNRVCVHKPV